MMNAEPLVSVCMTAYNHEPYLREAIEGVLAQRTDFAVELVVGDASLLFGLEVCGQVEQLFDLGGGIVQ